VESDADLEGLLDDIRAHPGNPCALDTEADSLHSYREKLCLVQMAWRDQLLIIDPLAPALSEASLSELLQALDACEIWFHGADFDMTLLLRTFGHLPSRILDTQLAARLVGEEKFGLANLIETSFGIQLSKSSQKADWGRRPLGEKMLRYAYDDVRYLLPLAERLTERLHELGRWAWFEEWCELGRANVLQRKERPLDQVWRISGWGKLDRKGLNFLRALWFWRDEESEREDRPPFKVMHNQLMLHLARRAAEGSEIRGAKGLSGDQSRRLRKAMAEASSVPEDEWPRRRLRSAGARVDYDPDVYQRLKAVRDEAARDLQLDPTIIATRSVLEALALNPSRADVLLMSWQRKLMFPDT